MKEDPADARAKRFEAERRKYSRLLAQVIEQAKLPIVELVKNTGGSSQCLAAPLCSKAGQHPQEPV